MPRHCYVVRVFTRGDEGGNHLGVVTDVTGLDNGDLQAIAADLGFSETTFLRWRDEDVPDVRIFTPGRELPFAGHPLVGTGWVLSALGPGGPRALRCEIGEVGLERRSDDSMTIDVPLDQDVLFLYDAAAEGAAVGVGGAVSAAQVMMPLPYLLVELADVGSVRAARPDHAAMAGHPERGMVYVYAWQGPAAVHARFFAAGAGVEEDPATGSAAVALAAAMQADGRHEGNLTIHQGEEIGHPSTIDIEWSDGRARVTGSVRLDEVRELAV